VPDSFLQEGKRNILGAATGTPHFFYHTHGAIGIPRVDEYGRGALQIRVSRQPGSYCVPGTFVIPIERVVMLGMQIMIQKDGIVGILAQKLLCLPHVVGHVDEVTLEPFSEPLVPALIVVQKKNSDRVAFSINPPDAKFREQ